MSEPILLRNSKLLDAVTIDDDQLSESIDVGEADCVACHFIWTGDPEGTVDTYASNDDINFIRVDYMSTAGEAGQHLLNIPKFAWKYMKVGFTSTSGDGTLTAYVSAKRR